MAWPLLKNVAVVVAFEIRDADGDLVPGATGLDSEVSLDGADFVDCTNEAVNLQDAVPANTGVYTLSLIAAEMNADLVVVRVKSTSSGSKDTVLVFYPTTRGVDDLAFPSVSGRSFVVETDGMMHSDLREWVGVAPKVLNVNRVDVTVGAMQANVIGAGVIAGNAITAAAIATDALGGDEFSQAAADKIWASAARTLTALGFNLANTDFAAGAIDAAAIAANAISDAELGTDLDTYQAKVGIIDDNAGTTDRYTVIFATNGQPVTSGITSPTIQVIKASDGSDLIASVALTEVAALGLYKHDATGAARVVSGAVYIAKVEAVIGGLTRTWYQQIGRDSS